MITKQIMHRLFSQADDVPFAVRYWDGQTESYGSGAPQFTLVLHTSKMKDLFAGDPQMSLGEAYVNGKIDVEGDLADAVAVAIRALARNASSGGGAVLAGLLQGVNAVRRLGRRSQNKQKQDVAHHYDLSNDFFRLWLDESMTYSCAYFQSPTDTLEQAQRQKVDYSLRKLRLRPGETLLDIGCGWGALIMRAAEDYGVRALGITLSEEQYGAACQAIKNRGLDEQADVRLCHYQTLAREGRQFDKIVSIGMIEHIGKAHLAEFAAVVQTLLKPGGLALLHFITSPIEGPFNAWMDKYIFPGAYLPTVSEMLGHLGPLGLRVLDVENLRPHYQKTLDHWSERFEECADKVQAQFGETFVRMWRLYLRSSSASFREATSEIHQILVSSGKTDLMPLTRADLYAAAG